MSALIEEAKEAPVPGGPIGGDAAWRGEELITQPHRWTCRLSEGDIGEIDCAIAAVRASAISLDRISPATFRLPVLQAE